MPLVSTGDGIKAAVLATGAAIVITTNPPIRHPAPFPQGGDSQRDGGGHPARYRPARSHPTRELQPRGPQSTWSPRVHAPRPTRGRRIVKRKRQQPTDQPAPFSRAEMRPVFGGVTLLPGFDVPPTAEAMPLFAPAVEARREAESQNPCRPADASARRDTAARGCGWIAKKQERGRRQPRSLSPAHATLTQPDHRSRHTEGRATT